MSISKYSLAAIQAALSKETRCPADAFALYVREAEQLVAWTPQSGKANSIFALLRCRGGGKGGFRKQLEKKGREFVRAKMKEKRNSAKVDAKKETSTPVKKREQPVKSKVLKAETSTTRTLVKQGLAFVMDSYRKKEASS